MKGHEKLKEFEGILKDYEESRISFEDFKVILRAYITLQVALMEEFKKLWDRKLKS